MSDSNPLDILDAEMAAADERLRRWVDEMVAHMHECSTDTLIEQAERLDRHMHSLGFTCNRCDDNWGDE